MKNLWRLLAGLIVLVAMLAAPGMASAARVAVFGDNAIDNTLATAGHTVTIVSDAQLATPGFLDNFDVFVYTRTGSSTGTSLSAAAAANVKAYVHRTVLLNGDFADAIGQDAEIEKLIVNSVTWAAATGHGYVGEFNGAFAGLTTNGNSLRPLDLISGTAAAFNASATDYGTINATAIIGASHPVLNGVALPRDPNGVEIGAAITGVHTHRVLARYAATNNPAVIVSDLDAAQVAQFGDNQIDEVLAGAGMDITLVSDAQLATPGFLDNFDVFVYTRTGSSTGASLSAAAAANVKAYVHRTVLLNGDFADAIGQDAEIEQLIVNSVTWAAATGHGYVGEFNGAFAGLTTNGNSLRPLDLISGAAAAFNASATDYGTINATAIIGASHPVLNGVALPRDPNGVEIGAAITGVHTHRVLARYAATNNPAVIVSDLDAAQVAQFGDNQIDEVLAGASMNVTIVSDAQLATPGFLDNFDVFVYTRTGSSTGASLSAAAAANVKAYVHRTVLLNGDFADAIGQDAEIEQLIVNSVTWAAATGHGYVGEFNGAFAGLTTNGNSLRPLDLISGAAAAFNASATDYGTINATAIIGASHPVLNGVALPRDPNGVEIGAAITGVHTHRVLARYAATNNPAVIVSDLDAAQVAQFGDNQIDEVLAGAGMDVTIVSDAQLATPGFLDNFDVFVYTRTGSSTGASLSAAAAANVKAYVRRTVLLNGDFADAIGQDAEIEQLIVNSVTWAAATGHGYVGEFNGAFAGLTTNGNSLRPLDLISGAAAAFNASATDYGTINATAIGASHAVLNGVALPRDPNGVEIGAAITGVDTQGVLARYAATNNPAVIVKDSGKRGGQVTSQ